MIYFENFIIEEGTKILIAEGTELVKAEVIKAEVIKKGVEFIEVITEYKNKLAITRDNILFILNPFKEKNIITKARKVYKEVDKTVLKQDITTATDEKEVNIFIDAKEGIKIIIEVSNYHILCGITKDNINYYDIKEVNKLEQITEYISKYY